MLKYRNLDLSFCNSFNLFREKEDPGVVYVILRNKLMTNFLKDFYLQTAVVLIRRLVDALPDDQLALKSYMDQIHRSMMTKTGDAHYTRKMGLLDTSMCLNKAHQEKFHHLLDQNAEMFQLREPFDREIRSKMMENRKLLSGMDKHKQLGALPKSKYDDVYLYTTNVKSRPSNNDSKAPKKETKRKAEAETPKKKKGKKKAKKENEKEAKNSNKGVETGKKVTEQPKVKRKSANVKKQDLVDLVGTIMVSLHGSCCITKKFIYSLYILLFNYLTNLLRLPMLKQNEQAIKKFFSERPTTVQNIIECAKLIYEYRNFKAQNILSSNYLQNLVLQVIKVTNASMTLKKQVLNNMFDTFMSYRIKSNATVAHAPTVDPVKLRSAIRHLYYDKKSKQGNHFNTERIFRNKISAMHALFCSVTGRRWIDITRIRWDAFRVQNRLDRIKIKFALAGSKANPKGKRNEGVTLVQDFSDLCPVKLLIEYWIITGRPKFGFVFPCVHKKVTFTLDCVDTWESYRCNGHKAGSKMRPCLGQLNGDVSWNVFRSAAIEAGCKVIPKRHTFRRLGCIIAHKFGMTRDQITTTFGWRFDSVMPNHYLQDELALDNNGFATKLAVSIQKDPNFEFLQDIIE